MTNRALVPLFLLAGLLFTALPAHGHGGGTPSLVVPLDHLTPGESFPVIAADFGSDAVVGFTLVATQRTADLGRVTAGPDGHFDASFDLPADFPLGWAHLEATGDDGSAATTQVLVGSVGPDTPPRPGRVAPWWQDPSVWLLGGIVICAVALVAWLVVRPKRGGRPAPR